MKPTLYEFEGQLLTAKEVQQLVSVFDIQVVRRCLKSGMNTRMQIASHFPRSKANCARIGKNNSSWKNWSYSMNRPRNVT